YAEAVAVCHPLEVFDDIYKGTCVYYNTNEDLPNIVLDIFNNWKSQSQDFIDKVKDGRKRVTESYTLNRATSRVNILSEEACFDELQRITEIQTESVESATKYPRVAMVTTWNSKCGIAETTADFLGAAKFTYKI